MKKITLIVLAVAGVALASCKKDRTCTCTDTYTPTSGSASVTTREVTIKKVRKGDALDGECNNYSYQNTVPAGSKFETKCELK
jgi:outer membrane lipoprotein SlyB